MLWSAWAAVPEPSVLPMRIDETVPARISVLYIGEGWQIEAYEIVDGYGKTIYYQIDIDNEKMATFFILKFL